MDLTTFATPIDVKIPKVSLQIKNGMVIFDYSFDGGRPDFKMKEEDETQFLLANVEARETDGRLNIVGEQIKHELLITGFMHGAPSQPIEYYIDRYDTSYEALESRKLIFKKPATTGGLISKPKPERWEWNEDHSNVERFALRLRTPRVFNIGMDRIIFTDSSFKKVDIFWKK